MIRGRARLQDPAVGDAIILLRNFLDESTALLIVEVNFALVSWCLPQVVQGLVLEHLLFQALFDFVFMDDPLIVCSVGFPIESRFES